MRDFAQVRAQGRITAAVARDALKLLEVDEQGFDEVDRTLLRTIIDKFSGGPVGVNSLAAAIHEEKDAIEDIYEPFLIQAGFLDRTPRGRVATPRAYQYFGLTPPKKDSTPVVIPTPRTPCVVRASRAWRPMCRRECSPTPISSAWWTPATNGSCSAPASASAISSTRRRHVGSGRRGRAQRRSSAPG